MSTATLLRRVNLIECLKEDAASAGTPRGDPPPGSDDWSDATLRAYYGTAPWPPPPAPSFAAWFPAAARAAAPGSQPPAAIVLAFACAGSAEDMWTSEGTGPRRAPSPLLAWAARAGVALLAAQLPGRAARRGDAPPPDAASVAGAILPLIAPFVAPPAAGGAGVPWAVVGHSLGAWLGFEAAAAAAGACLPPPAHLIVSAMPSPAWPPERRPWEAQAGLDGDGLRAECRAWGIADAVFEPGVWATYEGVLRADFRLFDEYVWRAPPPLACPVTAYHGDADTRVTAAMVAAWEGVTAAPTQVKTAAGPHLWPLRRAEKAAWLEDVVGELQGSLSV